MSIVTNKPHNRPAMQVFDLPMLEPTVVHVTTWHAPQWVNHTTTATRWLPHYTSPECDRSKT